MIDWTPSLTARLDARTRPAFAGTQRVYAPDYNGLGLSALPASVCAWLGVDAPTHAAPPLEKRLLEALAPAGSFDNVALLLVDGLGLDLLSEVIQRGAGGAPDWRAWGSFPERSLLAALTSLAPSTTAAALTTLWTGALPAEHGVIGYEVFLKEYSLIANMLTLNPASFTSGYQTLLQAGLLPEQFLPVPTLGPHLAVQGVSAHTFIHHAIANSGLSSMLHRGSETRLIYTASDLFYNFNALLETPAAGKRYIYLYWGGIDELMHRYGPRDERVLRELAAFSYHLGRFLADRAAAPDGRTLFVIAADHGHIATPPNPDYTLRSHPELLDCLTMLPSGEARLPYVFLRPGREERFLHIVERTWPGRFTPLRIEAFLSAGLLGNRGEAREHPGLRSRLGDWVMLPEPGDYWYFGAKPNTLNGRHGGLSRTEMLVPLLLSVL